MNIANIICWNCRGISARDTSSQVFRFIRTFKPMLVCLVETRANSDRVDRFCKRIPRSCDCAAILVDGFSGGIMVLWNKSIGQVTLVVVSRRALHIIISSDSTNSFLVSVIYNSS